MCHAAALSLGRGSIARLRRARRARAAARLTDHLHVWHQAQDAREKVSRWAIVVGNQYAQSIRSTSPGSFIAGTSNNACTYPTTD